MWKCRDKNIEYGSRTLVMGIVNVTPDSFSDGGSYLDSDKAVAHALEMLEQGADILDFGAQSTRPGFTEITPQQELERLEPVIRKIRPLTDAPISVDTYFPQVAQAVIEWGADIINDVSGSVDENMAEVVKSTGAGWVVMHAGEGGCDDVAEFFKLALEKCRAFGIDENQLCFDMGIGFGKTRLQDLQLIRFVEDYKLEGYPLLLGTSRKRVIGEYSHQPDPKSRVYGNISADTVAILGGADIVRLHDVKNEIQGIYMADALRNVIKD